MPGHWHPSKTCTQNGKPAARHKWAWDACNGYKKLQKQPPSNGRSSKLQIFNKTLNPEQTSPTQGPDLLENPFLCMNSSRISNRRPRTTTIDYCIHRNGSQVHSFIHSFMTHWSSTAPANAWWGRACTPSNKCGKRVRRSCHTLCTGHYYYHPCWIQLGFKPGQAIWERGIERWHDMWNSWFRV
jgi:hypothetical protein